MISPTNWLVYPPQPTILDPNEVINEARISILDADRCNAISITPATQTLLRSLRRTTHLASHLNDRVEKAIALYEERCNETVDGCSDDEEMFLADLIGILNPTEPSESFSRTSYLPRPQGPAVQS